MNVSIRRWIARGAFVTYAALFVAIVAIADRGHGDRYWHFIRSIPFGDKLGHLGLVGTLSLLLNLALGRRKAPGRLGFAMLGSVIVLAVMSLEELSQIIVSTRTFDVFDWLANLAGTVVGEMMARWLGRGEGRGESGPSRTGAAVMIDTRAAWDDPVSRGSRGKRRRCRPR